MSIKQLFNCEMHLCAKKGIKCKETVFDHLVIKLSSIKYRAKLKAKSERGSE